MAEDVQGLQELLKKLDDLDSLVTSKKLIVRALREGAEPIRLRAQELAPDDPTTPGSRVKEAMVTVVTEQTGTGAIALIGPARKAFFGQFAEFGTAHQSAEPFLRPAYDEQLATAVQIIGDSLNEGIVKEMAKR